MRPSYKVTVGEFFSRKLHFFDSPWEKIVICVDKYIWFLSNRRKTPIRKAVVFSSGSLQAEGKKEQTRA
jgi:hypothetical protein